MAADALSFKTYSMSDLKTKYANFMIPDFCIKVEGSQIQKSIQFPNLQVDEVRLKLSMDAAGALSFCVLNAYDLAGRCFVNDIKKKFVLGKIITAEIGYVGNLTEVFKGYIHSVTYEYSDSPVISVTALDFIRMMQENEVLKKTYKEQNPTEIFQSVMEKYNAICPDDSIKADSSNSQKDDLIQKGNDYRFVKDILCARECRDFYVLNGCAYFVDAEKKKSSVISLEWGKDILSFSHEKNYLDKCIQVNLADKSKQTQSIRIQKVIKGKDQKKVLTTPVIRNVSMEAEGTSQDALRQVKKAAVEELRSSVQCSGSCIGIPQIVPGRSLTITKMDQEIDGIYEIVSVEQHIGTDGFVTQFGLGGRY